MTIAVTLELRIKAGQGAEFAVGLKGMLGDTRARQGAEFIEMIVDQNDADHIIVYERWATKEDHQAYMAWRQERGDLDGLGKACAEPPAVIYFDIGDPG
jgi:quinol monooxygenase YgiN